MFFVIVFFIYFSNYDFLLSIWNLPPFREEREYLEISFALFKNTNMLPLKTGGELRCSGRVSSSCYTSDTRRVALVTNPVISHDKRNITIRASQPGQGPSF
jgi:hypothetical protein